jgi:ATP-dependent Clp endopeptidase proteolytic subunit ClpP
MMATKILLYGIIGDYWDGLDAERIVPLIMDSEGDLDVHINSPGGYVMPGLAIFNALVDARRQGRKVTCRIDGLAASMASVIAMAGGERIMADNALMMIHNPWDCACGDAAELRRAADKLDMIRDQIVKIYAQPTGIETDALIAMLDAETWLTSEAALAQNFVTSVTEPLSAAACDVSAFGFRKAPKSPHLVTSPAAVAASIITGGAKTGISSAVAAILSPKGNTMPPEQQAQNLAPTAPTPAVTAPAGPANPANTVTTEDAQALASQAAADAVAVERKRGVDIRALVTKHGLPAAFADELVADGTISIDAARAKVLDKLAERGDNEQIGFNGRILVGTDAAEKFMNGAANWIMVRSGTAGIVAKAAKARGETLVIDPGEFRGVSMLDLARESLAMAGITPKTRNPKDIMGLALTLARSGLGQNAVVQGGGDFPTLLENTMYKVLQAAYATTPDTWSRFCGIGTVVDFRAHPRYMKGTFGVLDTLNENGEFRQRGIPDGAKESITASTKGNIISLSRQALINDDLGAFSNLATDLGRAAKLTIETDVYAYLLANPVTGDGNAFFSVAHNNIVNPGAPPTVLEIDKVRQQMASQKDLSGNEFLDIMPSIWLGPLSLGGTARVSNGSQYDPDANNKLQRMNIALGVFSDIVDTPRLTGTTWYAFADPSVTPAIEVAFLDGVQEPFLDSEEGWRVDGTEWKVRIDYGIGGVNNRCAARDAGA